MVSSERKMAKKCDKKINIVKVRPRQDFILLQSWSSAICFIFLHRVGTKINYLKLIIN